MYPLHLETQFSNTIRRIFDSYNDALLTVCHDYSVRYYQGHSIETFLTNIEKVRDAYISSEQIDNAVKKTLLSFSAWQRKTRNQYLYSQGIKGDALRKDSEFVKGIINDLFLKQRESFNILFIGTAKEVYTRFYSEITAGNFITRQDEEVQKQGFWASLFGYMKTLSDTIKQQNTNKAVFWASDQATSSLGQLAKVQQEEVGIKGYIWRTARDSKVRDSHRELEGKYFLWSKGAQMPDGRWVHPGGDYNCRCVAVPENRG